MLLSTKEIQRLRNVLPQIPSNVCVRIHKESLSEFGESVIISYAKMHDERVISFDLTELDNV